jgi:hypothetical protein
MSTNIELNGMHYLVHMDNGMVSLVRAALPAASHDPLSPLEELVGEMYVHQEKAKATLREAVGLLRECDRALDVPIDGLDAFLALVGEV